MKCSAVLAVASCIATATGACMGGGKGAPPAWHPPVHGFDDLRKGAPKELQVDWAALKKDLKQVIVTEQPDIYPFDWTGSYGGFLIRQAWHCSGSYRVVDGRGGCDGARQRFNPELSWADNTQLDKAKRLLFATKDKYGEALSWGDLIIYTANVAIETMGGPVLGFCAGRVDDVDGEQSTMLGPDPWQNEVYHCDNPNNCTKNDFGTTNIGLIYVNPEGPGGIPDPVGESHDVRASFLHMSMNDTESVALIGGGHSFGGSHGACPKGAGESPIENPSDPWPIPGPCGNGVFTSGFNGSWSLTPTKWSNHFFNELVHNEWEVYMGPGGHHQWRVKDPKSSSVAALMMLTSDISLIHDPSYLAHVKQFADNFDEFSKQFSYAWYKLTTRDMGPHERCLGPMVPAPQPFQNPLPSPPKMPTRIHDVLPVLQNVMRNDSSAAAEFVQLAYQSASTVRVTDFLGGANGARIRFAPESEWTVNKGLDKVLKKLEPVKAKFGESLTWADLIVMAGTAGLTEFGIPLEDLPFCEGRSDASEGSGSGHLLPNGWGENYKHNVNMYLDKMTTSGIPKWAVVALAARPKSQGIMESIGYNGTWASELSTDFFKTIVTNRWVAGPPSPSTNVVQFTALENNSVHATQTDVFLYYSPELMAIARNYVEDSAHFKKKFAEAWTLLMNADRYDGPTGNKCY